MSSVSPAVAIAAHRPARERPRREVAALARIEGRRLLLHPVFLLGLALSMLFFRDEGNGATWEAFVDGFAYLPLACGTLVAANLGALRSRRDRTDELYESMPRPRSSRVAGQLLGLLWTLPIAGALMAAARIDNSFVVDNLGVLHAPSPGQLVQGPLMIITFGAIGILLARIAPSPIVGAVAVVALIAARLPGLIPAGSIGAWLVPIATDVFQYAPSTPCDPGTSSGCHRVATSAIAWHLSYFFGLTLLAAAAAMIPRRRPLGFAAVAALAVALAAATRLAAG